MPLLGQKLKSPTPAFLIKQTLFDLSTLSECFRHLLHSHKSDTYVYVQAVSLKTPLYLMKCSLCAHASPEEDWKFSFLPAIMTIWSWLCAPHSLTCAPSLISPLSILLHKNLLTHPLRNLKKQHCWRILILTDYMAAGWYTKGLWMGGKWSTWWYRFIWSAIWVFLLSGFLGDWALLWLTCRDIHI